ncbi:MAG: hypothetical protein LBK67_09635 [Coriobacteriales bacterium]|jgi:hypothetical protein|nr:hypothetical protein [Coriobacteriales bacterium]
MAVMITPAGDMEVDMNRSGVRNDKLFIGGNIGVWEADIEFERGEIAGFVKLILKGSVIVFVIKSLFSKRKKKKGE